MSSFAENILSPDHKSLSNTESLAQEPTTSSADFFKLYRSAREVSGTSSQAFPSSTPTNLLMQSGFQQRTGIVDAFGKHTQSSIGLTSAMASDVGGNALSYNESTFGGNACNSTLSWKQSSPDLQNQSRLNPSVHPSGSRVMSLHSELFKNHVGSSTSFFNQTGYPANNSNVSQAVDGGFSKDCLGQTWCPSPWSSGDRTGLDWDKRLRDPPNDMDISLPHSSNDAAWRYRTASDSGGLSPTHKRAPGVGRFGQTSAGNSVASSQQIQDSHRRRDRTLSGGSTSSARGGDPSAVGPDVHDINLPTGHTLNAEDFDVNSSLPTAMARMGLGGGSGGCGLGGCPAPNFSTSSAVNAVPSTSVDSLTANLLGQQGLFAFGNGGLDAAGGHQTTATSAGLVTNGAPASLEEDQLWLYEDPEGRIQGAFSSPQMLTWFLAGRYFTSYLRLRRKCDDTLSTLYEYAQLFGRIPFMGYARIPPIIGGITPQLILLYRMQQGHQPSLSNFDLRTKPARTLAGDDPALNPVDVLGKNGFAPPQGGPATATEVNQVLFLKLLAETIASNPSDVSINQVNQVLNILSGSLPNAQSDPSAAQEIYAEWSAMANSFAVLTSSSSAFGFPSVGQFIDCVNNGSGVGCSSYAATALAGSGFGGAVDSSWPRQVSPQAGDSLFPAPTVSTADQTNCGYPGDVSHHHQLNNTLLHQRPNLTPSPSAKGGAYGASFSAQPMQSKSTEDKHTPDGALKSSDCTPIGCGVKSGKSTSVSRKAVGGGNGVSEFQRAVSQSGCCSSCSSSVGGVGGVVGAAWSSESVGSASASGYPSILAAPGQPLQHQQHSAGQQHAKQQSAASIKTCWGKSLTSRVGKYQQPMANSHEKSSAIAPSPVKSTTATTTQGSTSTNNTPKKAKTRQQQQQQADKTSAPSRKAKHNTSSVSTGSSSSSSNNTGTSSGGSTLTASVAAEELNTLIQWVQSALVGIELQEKLDISTFVELLTTIDAPYEVESMLFAYLGNSSRSEQFVREFLDRRHTCWQLHRKRLEEMQNESAAASASGGGGGNAASSSSMGPTASSSSSKKHPQHDQSGTNGGISSHMMKAYSEPNESQADSPWQQIKPKGGSSRRAKKGAKQQQQHS